MCIPPYDAEPSPYFALLSKIANKFDIKYLSMGMSSDFEKAIQFSATHVGLVVKYLARDHEHRSNYKNFKENRKLWNAN